MKVSIFYDRKFPETHYSSSTLKLAEIVVALFIIVELQPKMPKFFLKRRPIVYKLVGTYFIKLADFC